LIRPLPLIILGEIIMSVKIGFDIGMLLNK